MTDWRRSTSAAVSALFQNWPASCLLGDTEVDGDVRGVCRFEGAGISLDQDLGTAAAAAAATDVLLPRSEEAADTEGAEAGASRRATFGEQSAHVPAHGPDPSCSKSV